jgi:predicted transcriptional regulator
LGYQSLIASIAGLSFRNGHNLIIFTSNSLQETTMSKTNINLQDDLEQPLAQLAKKLNQSRNWIINEAVKEFLEQRSFDEQRWQDTLAALDSVKNDKSISADKVEFWLASWGTAEEQVAPHQ